jgi:Zn-dependent metalloprotease
MKFLIFLITLFGFTVQGHAGSVEAKKYRWIPKDWKPFPSLLHGALGKILPKAESLPKVVGPFSPVAQKDLLNAADEMVKSGSQMVGNVKVDGTWMQTIFAKDGSVSYAAGAVFEDLPGDYWLEKVKQMKTKEANIIASAAKYDSDYSRSSRKIDPEIRLRKKENGTFEAYWKMEYLSPNMDQVFFMNLGENGELLQKGAMVNPGADGKALVFPQGPLLSSITEVPLRALNGDGTLTSRIFRITSALDLDVKSPNLLFFFPETDRRFDLSQVYYTMERAFDWMETQLGAQLKKTLEVKLHIGKDGISNAAFYHQNMIYLGSGDGIVYRDLPKDPSIVMHESVHAIVDSYAGLPSEGEGGALNEGFADFFAALILNNPKMGESSYLKAPYRRTLEHEKKAYVDFGPGVYQNGSIVAATLWDLRSVIGDEALGKLAFRALVRLGSGGNFNDFAPAVMHASHGLLSESEQVAVAEKLTNRGWKLQ